MVFTLSSVSYLDIFKYMSIATGVILVGAALLSTYFVITQILKKCIIPRLVKYRVKTTNIISAQKEKKKWYTLSSYQISRLIHLVWEFVETVLCGIISVTIVMEIEKWCVANDDFMIYVNTILAFVIGSAIVSYAMKFLKKISYLFNLKFDVGDDVETLGKRGVVVEIKNSHFVIEELKDEEKYSKTYVPLKLLNTTPVTVFSN